MFTISPAQTEGVAVKLAVGIAFTVTLKVVVSVHPLSETTNDKTSGPALAQLTEYGPAPLPDAICPLPNDQVYTAAGVALPLNEILFEAPTHNAGVALIDAVGIGLLVTFCDEGMEVHPFSSTVSEIEFVPADE